MKRTRKFWLAAAAVAGLALCAACNPKARVEAARQAAEKFHEAYNRGDFAGMFQLAGPSVAKTTSMRAFSGYESGVRARLGDIKSSQMVNYNLLYLFSGPQVRLDYRLTYEKGVGVESFEINFRKDRPVIDGYRLDSPQLEGKEHER